MVTIVSKLHSALESVRNVRIERIDVTVFGLVHELSLKGYELVGERSVGAMALLDALDQVAQLRRVIRPDSKSKSGGGARVCEIRLEQQVFELRELHEPKVEASEDRGEVPPYRRPCRVDGRSDGGDLLSVSNGPVMVECSFHA
jgi:hypothetical protein